MTSGTSLAAAVWLAVFCSVRGAPVESGNGGYQDSSLQNVEYGPPFGSASGYENNNVNEPANYDFQYEVYGGGNFFGHEEMRRDQKTQGKYHVLLPDGRRQVVTYWADESGYHPTITYEPAGDGSSQGGYGPPDNQLGSPTNRYSSRIKRQHFDGDENADVVEVYSSEDNPNQRFRNRKRRFTPKKGYLVVYPDFQSVTKSLKSVPELD